MQIPPTRNPHLSRKEGTMSDHRFANYRYLPHLAGALAFLVMVFAGVTSLHAQLSTRATITGTVTDGTGAVVSGATVMITSDSTKVAVKTETNSEGVYIQPGLSVATYSIVITKAGFKSYTVTGIELHPSHHCHGKWCSRGRRYHAKRDGGKLSPRKCRRPPLRFQPKSNSDEVSTLPMNGRNYQGLGGDDARRDQSAARLGDDHRGTLHQQPNSPSMVWMCRAVSMCSTAFGTRTQATCRRLRWFRTPIPSKRCAFSRTTSPRSTR